MALCGDLIDIYRHSIWLSSLAPTDVDNDPNAVGDREVLRWTSQDTLSARISYLDRGAGQICETCWVVFEMWGTFA